MKTKLAGGDDSLDNERRQFCPYHFNIIDFGKTSHEDVDIDKSSRICKKIKTLVRKELLSPFAKLFWTLR